MIEPEQVRRYKRHADALGKAAGDDPAAFAQAVDIANTMDRAVRRSVAQLVEQGFSWADIASALGISRQVAYRKYHRYVP